jgi:hypothetical protein
VLGAWHRNPTYIDPHPEVRRLYDSYFEPYTSPTDVKVYIGVE